MTTYATFLNETVDALLARLPPLSDPPALFLWLGEVGELLAGLDSTIQLRQVTRIACRLSVQYGVPDMEVVTGIVLAKVREAEIKRG